LPKLGGLIVIIDLDQHGARDDVTLLDGAGAALLDIAVAVAGLDGEIALGDVQVQDGVDRGDGHLQVLGDLRSRREWPRTTARLVELHDEGKELGGLPRWAADLLVDLHEEADELLDHLRFGSVADALRPERPAGGLRRKVDHVWTPLIFIHRVRRQMARPVYNHV